MSYSSPIRRQPLTGLLITLLCLSHALIAWAESPSLPLEQSQPLTRQQLELARTNIDQETALDATQKARIHELLEQADNWLGQADMVRGEISRLQKQIRDAPQVIQDLRVNLDHDADVDKALEKFILSSDLAALEIRISKEELNLTQARDNQKTQLEELSALLAGSKQISSEIAIRTDSLAQIQSDIEVLPQNELKQIRQARLMSLQARKGLREAEFDLLTLRLGNLSLLTNLSQARRDATIAHVSQLQSSLKRLNQAAAEIREDQAKQARQAAELLEQETTNLPLPLQNIAQENAESRSELEQLVYWEKRVLQQLTTAKGKLEQLQSDFEHSKQRVEVVGRSEAIGKMLSRRHAALPSLRSYRRSSAKRKYEINKATDRQIEIEELLLERGSLSDHVEAVTRSILENLSGQEKQHLQKQAFSLAGARREALNELQKAYGRYIGQLTSLDLAERQLLNISESYIDFINDQLLWVSSSSVSQVFSPTRLASGIGWLVSPEHWQEVGADLITTSRHNVHFAFILLFTFLFVVWKQPFARLQIPNLARATRKISTDSISLTIKALFYTLIKVMALPVVMIGTGLLLRSQPTAAPFTLAMATSLITVGITLTAALMLYQLCLPEGVGTRHLRWNNKICRSLAQELRWAIPVGAPFRFLIALGAGDSLPADALVISSTATIVLMIVFIIFTYRLLRKQGSLMISWNSINPNALLLQLHFLWFPFLILIGVGLIFSTGLGYMTLTLRLLDHVESTIWFFIGLFTLRELLLRYLYIAERRLRYQNALQRRDELRAQREQEHQQIEDESSVITTEIPELNFDALSEQAKRLVRFGYLLGSVIGAWLIWSDLLPALDFLDNIQLPINTSEMVDGIVTETPLTLRDIIIGIVILIVTFLAAKNLPGVLEITLLQRLPLESGARYALTTLLQYFIAGIGLIIAFSLIGFQWSNIQWLVAALGVGLGFGLQEIVANFVSGIILLFERPIRVGDVVTLDSTTGVVSRIRIRATTITNYDKQELLIPNKEFITGRVINWTLTDKVNRIIINVGVAYGTDVNKAMELMVAAAHENENVLQDPKPVATFEAFGDSALTLLLRTYLGSMDNRLATITALHTAINDKFSEAGIEIPFPQRDLHVINSSPLDSKINTPTEPR
ncbi:mechanosensitive ion channel domain-containing protein [Candidatus Thiodiazotropha sp. LNASS1]|uniref:mechanosensitive ion channel domain-containing protein n=1 Tax=Candidatus Thiodiazotropha sp. LNASS1 TaxID=3096260 RepID=UPI0034DE29B9